MSSVTREFSKNVDQLFLDEFSNFEKMMSIVLFRIVVHKKWICRTKNNEIIHYFLLGAGQGKLGSNIPCIMDERKGLIEQ